MLTRLENGIRPFTRSINMIGTVGLFIMMLMVTADVVVRGVFSTTITGATEVAELLQVLVVFLGLAYCESCRGHVRVDLLTSSIGRRAQLILDTVTTLIALALMGLMVWYSTFAVVDSWHSHEMFQRMRISVWPFKIIVPVGAFAFSLELVLRILTDVAGLRRGEERS